MENPDTSQPSALGGSSARSEETASQRLHQRLSAPSAHTAASSKSSSDSTADQESSATSTSTTSTDRKANKTYGRTPDGTTFLVPRTHDMVTQLLSPTTPKNFSDLAVLTILSLHVLLLRYLPSQQRIPVFAAVFLFWRAAYNIGIGWLLHSQSNHGRLVLWAKKYRLFVDPATGQNPRPRLYKFLQRELETKIPTDYSFAEAPVEYNTWLVFRRIVDLILMCDFTSYCLFAVACAKQPPDETLALFCGRWSLGIALVLFNLWVKLDAHRVVKDFAWYWGDFFYLIDQDLTFDGVFEMAPHPMYSVGYAGYYGISLMAASYKVLTISILAHAAQFAFLVCVESPHIEKVYNAPAPRKPSFIAAQSGGVADALADAAPLASAESAVTEPGGSNTGTLRTVDLHHKLDFCTILVHVYFFAFTHVTPSTPAWQAAFVVHAAVWRLWLSVGLGQILRQQSQSKSWTRHFVKIGETRQDAWREWRAVYHLSSTLTYHAFIAACWKFYSVPQDWHHGFVLFRHVIGMLLVALHVWTHVSIHQSLGDFGWFFGDFFFDENPPQLTYDGIYRFLNNPERFLGLAGYWGAVLVTNSSWTTALAVLSHVLALAFIQLVERPHMQKLYGERLRQDAGLVRSLKKTLPRSLRRIHSDVDKILDESLDFVEEFLETARPKFSAGVTTLVKDTSSLFQRYPARITLSRLEADVAGYDPKDYSLHASLAEGPQPAGCSDASIVDYGAPIKVRWSAPLNHSKMDWVGLYCVTDNTSREVTRVSSKGHWIPTNPGQYDSIIADAGVVTSDVLMAGRDRRDGESSDFYSGEMIFSGEKLYWKQGVFEFRYHHNGKHNVMAISRPFEIRLDRFSAQSTDASPGTSPLSVPLMSGSGEVGRGGDTGMQRAIESVLFPVVRKCLDSDPGIAPENAEDAFTGHVLKEDKYARRIVYAVQELFGIEFAPDVVRADGCVRNLAWRICTARRVLAPYNLQMDGTSTPQSLKLDSETRSGEPAPA